MAFYFKRENNMSSKIALAKYLSATKEYTEERIKEINSEYTDLRNARFIRYYVSTEEGVDIIEDKEIIREDNDKYIILNALNCSFYKELIYIMNQRNL